MSRHTYPLWRWVCTKEKLLFWDSLHRRSCLDIHLPKLVLLFRFQSCSSIVHIIVINDWQDMRNLTEIP